MTNRKNHPRPLAGGDYIRDERGLRQVEKTTRPDPGKSARDAARKAPAAAPAAPASADKPRQ